MAVAARCHVMVVLAWLAVRATAVAPPVNKHTYLKFFKYFSTVAVPTKLL